LPGLKFNPGGELKIIAPEGTVVIGDIDFFIVPYPIPVE
jgi:hypothetical protein